MAKIKIPVYNTVDFDIQDSEDGKGVDVVASGVAVLHINSDGSFTRPRDLDEDAGVKLNKRGQILLVKEAR